MSDAIICYHPPIGAPVSGGGGGGGIDLTDVARLSLPNVFLSYQTLPGVRLNSRTVTANASFTVLDYEIRADASGGAVSLTLPPALGTKQFYRAKKIDPSTNPVAIIPFAGDLIDGQTSFILGVQEADIAVIDGTTTKWDKCGVGIGEIPPDVARLSIPNTFTDWTVLPGVKFPPRFVFANGTITDNDFGVMADATSGAILLTLPPAVGSGQFYRVKKIDASVNVVTVQAVAGDSINESISVNFADQDGGALLYDCASHLWDNIGTEIGVQAIIPDTQVSWWYRPGITNDAQLAAFPTAGNPINSRMDCVYADGFRTYLIRPLAKDPSDPGHVAPNDYNSTTNNVHWESKI